MNAEHPKPDYWRWPTLAMWLIFLVCGLFPELVYTELRNYGGVLTQHAMVNSEYLLPLLLTAYFAWFVYQRCLEAGLSPEDSRGRAAQLAIYSLVAFLPVRLHEAAEYWSIPERANMVLVVGFAGFKCVVWIYLLSIILRYYCISGYQVFRGLPSLFPSLYLHDQLVQAEEDKPEPQAPALPPAAEEDPSHGT